MERIHVTLPSNSSMTVYPDNKPQNYKTNLAQPLDLEGRWEVALNKIDLTNDWDNVLNESKYKVHINYRKDGPKSTFATFIITLSKGYFSNVMTLGKYIINVINEGYAQLKIKDELKPLEEQLFLDEVEINFEYDLIRNRVAFSGTEFYLIEIAGSEHLTALGFTIKERVNIGDGFKFPSTADKASSLNRASHIYVYSDVGKPHLVGDVNVPLLDHFPIKVKHGEIQNQQLKNPIFVPVANGYISTIEIKLTDDTGELIPIQSGKVICDLEFRKCKPDLPRPLPAPIPAITKD